MSERSSGGILALYGSLLLPVFTDDRISWLGLVLHRFVEHSLGLLVRPPLFKQLSPGHVEGGRPGADAFTEDVAEERQGV